MKNQHFIFICLISLLSFFSSCTFNSVTSPVATNLKYVRLFKNTKAEIVMNAALNAQSDDNKYFNSSNLEPYSMDQMIIDKFHDYGISKGGEKSRFKITITDISYTEVYEDHQILIDPREDNYNFETLTSRDITFEISMTIQDRLTNTSRRYTSVACESTRIKKNIFGRGHKESWIPLVSLEHSLLYRAAKKSAGKAAGHLRKRKFKKDKEGLFE